MSLTGVATRPERLSASCVPLSDRYDGISRMSASAPVRLCKTIHSYFSKYCVDQWLAGWRCRQRALMRSEVAVVKRCRLDVDVGQTDNYAGQMLASPADQFSGRQSMLA